MGLWLFLTNLCLNILWWLGLRLGLGYICNNSMFNYSMEFRPHVCLFTCRPVTSQFYSRSGPASWQQQQQCRLSKLYCRRQTNACTSASSKAVSVLRLFINHWWFLAFSHISPK